MGILTKILIFEIFTAMYNKPYFEMKKHTRSSLITCFRGPVQLKLLSHEVSL